MAKCARAAAECNKKMGKEQKTALRSSQLAMRREIKAGITQQAAIAVAGFFVSGRSGGEAFASFVCINGVK